MKPRMIKKRIIKHLKSSYRMILGGALLLALGCTMLYKKPAQAASDRGKTAAGVIIGGGAGGGIAAAAGSAKWFPLGFGVGGLAGGLIARRIIKNRRERKAQQQAPSTPRYKKRRYRYQQPNQFGYQPTSKNNY